jgi:four helix bundle protein
MTGTREPEASSPEQSRGRQYDLEERTLRFAKQCRVFAKRLPASLANQEDLKQLLRASGSVGANYIEANEALSKRDFLVRIKISRKEAKESRYWLDILDPGAEPATDADRRRLREEAVELMKIFGAILRKSERA